MLKKYQRKNKNNIKLGFTLIELLAVIVVLSVIALIAVPNVNDIVNNSRKSAAESSAQMLAKAAESYFANQNLIGDSVDKVNLADETLSYTGDKPDVGYAFFDEDGRAYVKMYYNGYCVIRDYKGKVESDKISPDNCEIANMVSVTLYTNGGVLTNTDGWNVLENSAIKVLQSGTNLSEVFIEKPGYTFKGWYDANGNLVNLSNTIIEDITVTARWEANTYTITLDLAGGIIDGEYESTRTITYGESYGELPNPSKSGYTFKGWYTSGGLKVDSKTVVSNPSNHTLYANYEANKYTLTFKYNDNVTNDTEKTVIYGESYGELPEPSRDGYTFQGWFTEITGGTKLLATNMVTTTSNHTLYAQWGVNVYTLTFVYNNGLANTTKTITYGAEYGELPEPTKTGYTFTGWYTFGGTEVLSTDIVQTDSNQELYAQWTANNHTVTFVYGNGSANTTKSVTYDSTYGELPNPSRTGYTFNGWYTTGGSKVESTTTVKITAAQTLTASWTAKTFTITFNSNGGSIASGTNWTGSGTSATKTVTYDSTYGTLPTATKVGYTFQGWATSGGTTIAADSTVSITSNTTLYAQWGVNSYLVTFDANGGSVTTQNTSIAYGSTYGTLPTATRTGYTFKGWYTASTSGTVVTSTTTMSTASNHTIYAQWTVNTYTVTFVGQKYEDGTPIYFNPVTSQLCTASEAVSTTGTKEGCMKWYIFLDDGSDTINLLLDHNTTKQVAWNANGGTTPDTVNAQLQTDVANWNASIKSTARLISASEVNQIAPTASGYTWTENGTTSYYFHTGTTTIYQGAAGTNKYAWLFDNTSGCTTYGCNRASSGDPYGYWTSSYSINSFAWYIYSDGNIRDFGVRNNDNRGVRPVITISKSVLGTSGTTSTKTVTYGSTYGTLPTPTRSGYTFKGWYTTGGVKVESTTTVTNASNHTLYAQWTANTYTITLYKNNYWDGDYVYFNPVTNQKCTSSIGSSTGTNNGCMKWYTFLDNGTSTNVKMLLDHNTTGKIAWNTNASVNEPNTISAQFQNDIANWNATVKSTSRLITAYEINQIAPTSSGFTWNITNIGAPYNLHNGNGNVYTGAAGTSKFAWLFDNTLSCTSYGCNQEDSGTNGYWTLNYGANGNAWAVHLLGFLDNFSITSDMYYGIRPMIEVSRSIIGNPNNITTIVTYNSTYGTLPTPTRNGYRFVGWNTKEDGTGTMITSSTIVSTASDHTLYAQWQSNCFVAGTQVYTENGYKNIEDIKVGEKVYSYNFDTNSLELSKVVDTIRNTTNTTYKMTIGNSELEMTHMHPLYIVGKGWVEANKINIGDKILDANGNTIEITNITAIEHSNPIPIYNITVDGNHNYYVSNNRILVHNKGDK